MQTNPAQALESWHEEKRSAWLYRIVSDAESGTTRQMLFLELAQAAEKQAAIWEAKMVQQGGAELPARYHPRAARTPGRRPCCAAFGPRPCAACWRR